MPATQIKGISSAGERRRYIGTNSATITAGDLVGLSGGFATKLGATGAIEGIAEETKTFTSNNQTVAKATVQVTLPRKGVTFALPCSSGSLAQADVGSYFLINSSQEVDYTTKTTSVAIVNTSDAGAAADPVVGRQVRLVEYIGEDTSRYEFVVIG